MNYSIFVLLLVCFIFFPEDTQANFTKESCLACCNALPEYVLDCAFECHKRWSGIYDFDFNSRRECERTCAKNLLSCKQLCLDDCASQYVYIPREIKPPSRLTKKRYKRREVLESAGLPVYKTTPRNPDSKKPRQVRRKRKSNSTEEAGTSAA